MSTEGSLVGKLAVRNTVWLAVFSYAGQFIAFAATLVLTRLLGPEVFGLFSLGNFWASLLGLRQKSGLSQAAIRQPRLSGELLGTVYRLDLALAVGSVFLCAAAALALSQSDYPRALSWVLLVLALAEALPAVVGPLGLAMEMELQLSRLTLVSLFSITLAYGTAMALAYAHMGIWSLLVMSLLTAVVGAVGVYLVCRRRLPWVLKLDWRFDPALARVLLAQGLPVGLSGLGMSVVVSQYDNFLIGTFVDPVTLGYYDRAFRLSQWPNVLLTAALARVGYLTFARLQDDLPRLIHAVRLCLWVIVTIATPMALVLSFGAQEVVEILYGPAWLPSSDFLRFLAIYSLLSPFTSIGGSLAYAMGHIRATVLIAAAQATIIVLLATPLTLFFGASGTLIGVGLTAVSGFGLSAYFIFKHLPLSPARSFGPALVAVGAASAATFLLTQVPGRPDWHPLLRLALIGASSAGVYLLTLLAFAPGEMLDRARYLTATFRGRKG